MNAPDERLRRWRLALGVDDDSVAPLSDRDAGLDRALSAIYGRDENKGRGGLGGSAPKVARWLGDVREYFPTSVVQLLQRDAFERHGLQQMLLQPELLSIMEADVHLVADLMALRGAIPESTKETARAVVRQVVTELMKKLEQRTVESIRGALDRSKRTSRPRPADIDWGRTIQKNLSTWLPEHRTVIPERLVGHARRTRTRGELDEVILCVDQSGSMATSVVYSSIFAAVLASIPALATKLVCFDTAVLDLTEELEDPVDVLFGVQLGGGTDIDQAVAYVEELVTTPTQTHVVLITDLYEGGDAESLVARAASLISAGVQLIVLLALSDDGKPAYDADLAGRFAALGSAVFACTPDQFPDLMAAALKRMDLEEWAASQDIALVRGAESDPE